MNKGIKQALYKYFSNKCIRMSMGNPLFSGHLAHTTSFNSDCDHADFKWVT